MCSTPSSIPALNSTNYTPIKFHLNHKTASFLKQISRGTIMGIIQNQKIINKTTRYEMNNGLTEVAYQ